MKQDFLQKKSSFPNMSDTMTEKCPYGFGRQLRTGTIPLEFPAP